MEYDVMTRTRAPLVAASDAAHSIAFSDDAEPSKPTTNRWWRTGLYALVEVMTPPSRRRYAGPRAERPAGQGRSPLMGGVAIRQSGSVTESSGADRTVVVGVDGSAGSAVALQWAIDHADHLGVVEPVMAFSAGLYTVGFGSLEGEDEAGGPYRYDAFLRLRAFLLEHAPSLVDVGRVVEGRAGAALLDAAAGSELLVVGTRGWSSRVDLSLGSVGAYCARHSTVPVALIPPEVPPIHDRLDVVVGFDGSPHARAALQWAFGHLRRSARACGDPSNPTTTSSRSWMGGTSGGINATGTVECRAQ
jgi:nucleotide-binding universal stress UspA family protein